MPSVKNPGQKAEQREQTDVEAVFAMFDNSPSRNRKFLHAIVERYRTEEPNVEDKKAFCRAVVEAFFPYYKREAFDAQQKKLIDRLIKERVKKAGGFLRLKEQGHKLSEEEFDQQYRDYEPAAYEQDYAEAYPASAESGYFIFED